MLKKSVQTANLFPFKNMVNVMESKGTNVQTVPYNLVVHLIKIPLNGLNQHIVTIQLSDKL